MEDHAKVNGGDISHEKSDTSAESVRSSRSGTILKTYSDSDKEQLLRTSSDDVADTPQDIAAAPSDIKLKTTLFQIRLPTKSKRLSETDDEEPSSESSDIQKSPAKSGKKTSRKGDHVTFEDAPDAKGFEFVPQKAAKFGLGSSSSDHNFQVLPDETEDDDGEGNIGSSHTSDAESPQIIIQAPSSGKTKEAPPKPEQQESSVIFAAGKEQLNRSFIKSKLSSPHRKRNSHSENKIEKSPLLGKPASRSSPVSSIDSTLLRPADNEDGSDNTVLSSPLRSELDDSSEEDSPFTNTSEDADNVLSPSIVSDDGAGVCSKYSQLSEDGSSPSSPTKSATATVEEDDKDKPETFRERVVFEHSLELGIAFSEFVDVDAFRTSLGKSSPHTEDGFGGRSEEHLLILLRGGSNKGLKSYLRNSQWPAESDARRHLWENLCNHLLKAEEHLYQELADDISFPQGMGDDLMLPAFVDIDHLHSYFLTTHGIQHAKVVINVLSSLHPDVIYCPMLYPMTCLFLHYMQPEACFNCMQAMLASTRPYYFTQTKIKTEASKYVLRDLAKKYAKQAYVLMVRSAKSVEAVFDNWMWWIFRDLPFQYLVRIIDSFLLEGYKVLYRISLAIVILYAKESSRHGSRNSPVHNINAAISRFCKTLTIDPKRFIKAGFSIRGLSRKEITKLHDKNEAYLRSLPAKDHSVPRVVSSPSMGNISIARSFNGPRLRQHVASAVLSPEMLQTIWQWIPVRLSLMRPKMLFSSDEHGTAIRTLYNRSEHAPMTILAIKTTTDEIFGAFCSSPWSTRHEKNKPHTSFFGTGETFVFSLSPVTRRYPWVGLLGYPPDHTADLFMAGDEHMLVIGSGNGEAIYLDTMMNRCSSTHCTTFDNEPLCSLSDFSCRVVEVFGFID